VRREVQVRKAKETDRPMGTHALENTEGGTKIRTAKEGVKTRSTYFLKSEKGGTSRYSE
jgi:hypothetical protein